MKQWLVLLLALVLVGGSSTPDAGPTLVVSPGLAPRMTARQVSERVLALIHRNEEIAGRVMMPPRVLSLTATTGAGIAAIEPAAGQHEPVLQGIVWVVRAEGTFTTNRGPNRGVPPTATTGFYVLADVDGSVISFGFP